MTIGSVFRKFFTLNDLLATPGCVQADTDYQSDAHYTESRQNRRMPSEFEIESFIGSCFRSVWALELVQFLLCNEGKSFAHEDLVAALRASESVVSQSVTALLTVGLIKVEDDRIELYVADGHIDELLRSSVALYQTSPNRVRRLIVAATSPGLTAFSNAFRLRKD